MPKHKHPNTLTKELLEAEGYMADVVERQTGRIKRDFLGLADVLGLFRMGPYDGVEVLLVQATSPPNRSARIKKLQAHPNLPKVLATGAVVEVISWKGEDLHSRVRVYEDSVEVTHA